MRRIGRTRDVLLGFLGLLLRLEHRKRRDQDDERECSKQTLSSLTARYPVFPASWVFLPAWWFMPAQVVFCDLIVAEENEGNDVEHS